MAIKIILTIIIASVILALAVGKLVDYLNKPTNKETQYTDLDCLDESTNKAVDELNKNISEINKTEEKVKKIKNTVNKIKE
jgi:uncharacterized membrane protein YraQ (UPF0718 family)